MLKFENNLILLESFLEEKEAYKSRILLEKNRINHKYFCSRSNFEKAYLTSNSNPTEIWVNKEDFKLAFEIIRGETTNEDSEINIRAFSNEELIEIIKNPDEWHESFINKAKNILKEQNISINSDEIDANIKEKLNIIKCGKSAHPATIFIFWILTIFSVFFMLFGIFSFVFGFSGIIAGYLYWKSKITASDNHKYYLFNNTTRIHGKYMFFVGLMLMTVLFVYVYYLHFISI